MRKVKKVHKMIARFIAIVLGITATVLTLKGVDMNIKGFDPETVGFLGKIANFAIGPFLVALVYCVYFATVFIAGIGFAMDRSDMAPVVTRGGRVYTFEPTFLGRCVSCFGYLVGFVLIMALILQFIPSDWSIALAVVFMLFALVEHILFFKVLIWDGIVVKARK